LSCLALYALPRDLHAFPTRRSSDLIGRGWRTRDLVAQIRGALGGEGNGEAPDPGWTVFLCRPSTGEFELALARRLTDRVPFAVRSEEHTSELQSRGHLVCRLLLEKK